MNATLRNRLAKIENSRGADALARWVNSLTEEQLEARLNELLGKLRRGLEAHGVDCRAMSPHEMLRIHDELETA